MTLTTGSNTRSLSIGPLTLRVAHHPVSNPLARWRFGIYLWVEPALRYLMVRLDW